MQPLLKHARYASRTTVLDSVKPFRAPHIIISEPPPQTPWVGWDNATVNPQDAGWGKWLTVPSGLVQTINERDEDDDDEGGGLKMNGFIDGEAEEYTDEDDEDESE